MGIEPPTLSLLSRCLTTRPSAQSSGHSCEHWITMASKTDTAASQQAMDFTSVYDSWLIWFMHSIFCCFCTCKFLISCFSGNGNLFLHLLFPHRINQNPSLQKGPARYGKGAQEESYDTVRVFIRQGRDEESVTLIRALAQESPTQATTLYVMTVCYKETDQLDKICQMFISASKQHPGNEELISRFIVHMRVNDFKAQQTTTIFGQ